uniref:G-protein coupled receptors family 1 profile domain-containing protein n=1 Tax=Cyprinus carpio carpio TaxID=630221 RepID=A0A9J8AS29_CYPCA
MLVVLLILHAISCAHSHGPPGATVPGKQCPSACQCEEDGILLLVDCSEQGLSSVPTDISPLTSYLDLSMNNISEIQPIHLNARTLSGMRSLRHLWLDDNALTEIPVRALNDLSSLQAMTLALNRITHIPDYAFRNLSNLVVLHLHNNMIRTLGQNCFEGLHSLETLELNFNDLQEFPVAIRTLAKLQELGFHNNNIKAIPERAFVGNPLLQTIHFYENPIQFVGRSAFQFLPKLHTLSLNGATEIREFPDLKGTTSLQVLKLAFKDNLYVFVFRELSHNAIEELPSFYHCKKKGKKNINNKNSDKIQIARCTDEQMKSHYRDLSWNSINTIHPDAFSSLQSLIKLDLTGNRLSSLPLTGLTSLTHLKLKGNIALSRSFRVEDFPNIRVIEMPYAYQCCVFGACNSYKAASQWEEQMGSEEEDLQKKALSLFPIHTDNNYDLDLEEFQLAIEESKLQTSIQCTPIPGPFKPCDNLFDSWVVRLGMWLISLVSLMGNSLLLLTVFASPSYLSPVKFIIGTISGANLLTGLCTGTLALVDARTFGEFALHGAQWEMGAGCQATGFLSVLASEGSILFLTLAAVQCSVSVSCARAYGKSPSLGSVRAAAVTCLALSLAVAALPLIGVGEYGATPLCMPSPLPDGEPTTLGFMVALIMMNSLCFLVITGTYIKLYWDLMKGEFDSIWDCAMIKHVAWLIFTNCLLYCPVAFLTFSSLLGLFPVSEEVVKSVVLVLLPLPASINPLLYLLFNPHFREDARLLLSRAHHHHDRNMDSFVSVDTEKSSYDSTQALVSFAAEADAAFESSSAQNSETVARFSCPPPAPLIPCQIQMNPSTERDNVAENLVRSTPGLIVKEQEHLRSSGLDTHNGTSFSGVYHSTHLSTHF